MKPNLLFLLGGSDLEMETIETLLKQNSMKYLRRDLTWSSAKVSAYEDIIRDSNNADLTIYGIELAEDALEPLPPNYRRIDHHNELSGQPSSLEQMAAILGIKLTREQQLIAANDKG
jgi:hypothetical protein